MHIRTVDFCSQTKYNFYSVKHVLILIFLNILIYVDVHVHYRTDYTI